MTLIETPEKADTPSPSNVPIASPAEQTTITLAQSSEVISELPAGAKYISSSKCYTLNGEFIHEMTPTYQDTNSVGNVYFAMYGLFVGKTRELFFRHTMPEFDIDTSDFLILTKAYSHKFASEIREFDTISIHIRIKGYNRKFVTMAHRILNKEGRLIGKGEQELMFVDAKKYNLIDIPTRVVDAHLPYYKEAQEKMSTK